MSTSTMSAGHRASPTTARATACRKRRRSCSPTPTLTPPLSPAILKSGHQDSSRPLKRMRARADYPSEIFVDTPAATPSVHTATATTLPTRTDASPLTPPPLSRSPPPPPPLSSGSLEHAAFAANNPNFGELVMDAYIANMRRHKQQDAAFARIQHSCRVTKYGAELAKAYTPGSTPPSAREKYREWMMEERYTGSFTPSRRLDHVQSSDDDNGAQTPASDVVDSPPAHVVEDEEEGHREEQSHTLAAKSVCASARRNCNSKSDLDALSRCSGSGKLTLDVDKEVH
ncbi:uncharacterized protein MYCFIDRAFT_212766 [Pseudocercospora fijiensis CIRAD86]|uniref:Uncharacterized protein n=1 Tax=Pseudocercospora fijiensis (strain CIRAD86) TaxID=383855 RepID=M3AH08_PSEFD|nr:uncharacterized protein MYCFIDRAFT_212766 [Pseudocercospora fijiensis CIRAD86]EME76772.1 hypothetical protein MYCFIDRAFT_212766 [Pseudocercospora fijiensis CIRAD86]